MIFRKNHQIAIAAAALTFALAISVKADEYVAPTDYYSSAEGTIGTALDGALNSIIRGHTVISYSDLPFVFRVVDRDPQNTSNVILLYSGQSMSGNNVGSSGPNVWNREHTWPQSFGPSTGPAYSDLHHLFPCNASVNSTRSNLNFDWTNPNDRRTIALAPGTTYDSDSFEPRDVDKGRIARAMFYMATRYDGRDATPDLKLANRPNSSTYTLGWLDALLQWNRMFAPDDYELRRNHLIYQGTTWGARTYRQGNRNPFTDHPELADAIYLDPATVTYGNWRWRHFTVEELLDTDLSGDLADPDADGIVNLIELATNNNPHSTDLTSPLEVIRNNDGSVTLKYVELKSAALSGLTYALERSIQPVADDSWMAFSAGNSSAESETVSTRVKVFSVPGYSESGNSYSFRLKVHRAYPIGNEGEAFFDPVAVGNINGSIFAYDPVFSGIWSDTFMGWLWDDEYPWVYHNEHLWIYFSAAGTGDVWVWDANLGWLWTDNSVYPHLYQDIPGRWLWHYPDTVAPSRWFHDHSAGQLLPEQDFYLQ